MTQHPMLFVLEAARHREQEPPRHPQRRRPNARHEEVLLPLFNQGGDSSKAADPRQDTATVQRRRDAPSSVDVDLVRAELRKIKVVQPKRTQTPCQANQVIFLGMLDEPPERDATSQERARYAAATHVARSLCEDRCPRFEECRKEALTGPEVEGFMAGTTSNERRRLRDVLKVQPAQLDLAAISGAPEPQRRVDPVLAERVLRRNPEMSLPDLMAVLECSDSSAKRWRTRILSGWSAPEQREPTSQEIANAYEQIITPTRRAI